MPGIDIFNGIVNNGGIPSGGAGLLANRPAAGVVGRLFIGTDTNLWYRDTGTAWVSISGTGTVTGTGSAGQAAFWSSGTAISGDNTFFWDNTNKRLGLGTTTPGVRLDVHGTGVIQQINGTTTNDAFSDFQNAGSSKWRVGNNYNGGIPVFSIQNRTNVLYPFLIFNNNNVLFGSNDLNGLAFTGTSYGFVQEGSTNFFNIVTCVNADNPTTLYLQKTRGTTKSNYATTVNGDTLAQIQCIGTNGTAYVNASSIQFKQSGTTGSNYLQADINFLTSNTTNGIQQLLMSATGYNTFTGRVNVNNATDNSNYELNVNGNTYTGGISPTILTVGVNTNMARTATGYYCTAAITLTLPTAAGLNNWYIVITSGSAVTVQRNGTDTILDKTGASVTSVTVAANTRSMFYVGGGTITFQIF